MPIDPKNVCYANCTHIMVSLLKARKVTVVASVTIIHTELQRERDYGGLAITPSSS